MFVHSLAKKSRISHQIQRDGTVKTILHVEPTTPSAPGSSVEPELIEAIVEYMKKHGNIDHAEVGS